MKTTTALLTIIALAVLALAPAAATAQDQTNKPRSSSYLLLKGGIYDPSERFTIDDSGLAGIDYNSKHSSFYGEAALGHYFTPFLAFEVAGGWFENEGDAIGQPGRAKFEVIPVLFTGKLVAPLGPVEPFILGGIGAYLTDFTTSADSAVASGTTKLTYGFHAGAGVNVDFTRWFFVNAEGKYLWSEPSFGGRDITLDGFTVTGGLGFRF